MSKEQVSAGEKAGTWIRNGGIVAGIIGLLANAELLVAGLAAAAGGEIFRRNRKAAAQGH